jgi:hypothetical protein
MTAHYDSPRIDPAILAMTFNELMEQFNFAYRTADTNKFLTLGQRLVWDVVRRMGDERCNSHRMDMYGAGVLFLVEAADYPREGLAYPFWWYRKAVRYQVLNWLRKQRIYCDGRRSYQLDTDLSSADGEFGDRSYLDTVAGRLIHAAKMEIYEVASDPTDCRILELLLQGHNVSEVMAALGDRGGEVRIRIYVMRRCFELGCPPVPQLLRRGLNYWKIATMIGEPTCEDCGWLRPEDYTSYHRLSEEERPVACNKWPNQLRSIYDGRRNRNRKSSAHRPKRETATPSTCDVLCDCGTPIELVYASEGQCESCFAATMQRCDSSCTPQYVFARSNWSDQNLRNKLRLKPTA